MAFNPAFEKHAIDVCEMAFAVLPSFDNARLQAIREVAVKWSEELPSRQLVDASDVRGQSIVPLAPPDSSKGFRYAYLRPNGFPIWELVIANNEIRLVCSRYASWSSVWAFAEDVFSTLFDTLAEFDPKKDEDGERFKIVMAALRYDDRFVSEKPDHDFSGLFNLKSRHLPQAFSSWGDVWHLNTGWYGDDDLVEDLNLLSLNSRLIEGDDSQSCEVIVDHTVQTRLSGTDTFPEFPEWSNCEKGSVFNAMQSLHGTNMNMLRELLTKDMQEAIGMDRDE